MCVPYGETPQGYEVQFQTNYLGHYLFTRLLLPLLLSTVKISPKGTVRIVNVSSDDHAKLAPKEGIVFSESCKGRRLSRRARYGMSKLANVLHSKELALRYGDEKNGLLALSLHPGIFKSYVCPIFLSSYQSLYQRPLFPWLCILFCLLLLSFYQGE
jgi:NAD(P)-dependent dehydrogenase (short-subunit alcohol dehydrogenase family)